MMEEKIKNNNIKLIIVVFVTVALIIAALVARNYFIKEEPRQEEKKEEKKEMKEEENTDVINEDFNIEIIKNFNKSARDNNYLVSPYNIEIALNMLRDGADGKSKEELDRVLGNRKINDISVKNKIGIANGVFIKTKYKNDVKQDYYNVLKDKYNSDIIYDEYKTPTKINNWVKEKTYGMIENVINEVDESFIIGLASALAIDVKWLDEFECVSTRSAEFTKINNEIINVEMMNNMYKYGNYSYFKNDDAIGIILPYQKEDNSNVQLEFVGILPNDKVDNYVNGLTKEKLASIDKNVKKASDKLHIILSLPRFNYSYSALDLKEMLVNMGIVDVFSSENANLKRMIELSNRNAYVSGAIHKTYIDLNERGTRAAAITFFGIDGTSAQREEDYEEVRINFNKPFAYMIREANTKEVLFFGVVYEPNIWNGSTCDY